MTSPVIVATDGSSHSLRVLGHAKAISSAMQAPLQVLRVLEKGDLVTEPGQTPEQSLASTEARIREDLQAACRRHGIEGEIRVEHTNEGEQAVDALLRLSDDAALLAMHSRGRSGLARLLGGSVALGVLGHTERPVMLGGPELHEAWSANGPYRLLITTDLSPASEDILRATAPLLERGNFQVTLAHVHERAPAHQDNDAEVRRHEAHLEEQRRMLPEGTEVTTTVRQIARGGGIDTAILEVARDIEAHAIAMSTHGHSAKRSLLMGSVALSVLGRSTLPLVVARA